MILDVRLLAGAALIVAAVTAIALAARRPAYAPLSIYLAALALADGVRGYLASGVLSAPGPYVGGARAAFHLEEGLFLASLLAPAVLAVTAFRSFIPVRVIVDVYAVAVLVLIVGYPMVRGADVARVYLGAETGALAVSAAAVIQWGWRVERPTLEQMAVLMVLGVEAAKVAGGPWRIEIVGGWERAWPMHAVLYLALAGLQVLAAMRNGKRGERAWSTR